MTTTVTTPILPDHVLSGILTLAKRRKGVERLAFRGHDATLQQVFDELRSERHFPLLEAFVFSDTGPVPYSPILNESVSKLQLSRLIGRENPDYEVLFLRPAAEDFYDKFLSQQLSPGHMTELVQITHPFLAKISLVY